MTNSRQQHWLGLMSIALSSVEKRQCCDSKLVCILNVLADCCYRLVQDVPHSALAKTFNVSIYELLGSMPGSSVDSDLAPAKVYQIFCAYNIMSLCSYPDMSLCLMEQHL